LKKHITVDQYYEITNSQCRILVDLLGVNKGAQGQMCLPDEVIAKNCTIGNMIKLISERIQALRMNKYAIICLKR